MAVKTKRPRSPEEYIEMVRRFARDPEGFRAAMRDDTWIKYIKEVLWYEPTEPQIRAFAQYRVAVFEKMPAAGVMSHIYERPWGKQLLFRHQLTGRWIPYKEVERALTLAPPGFRLEWVLRKGTLTPLWRDIRTGRIREIPYPK